MYRAENNLDMHSLIQDARTMTDQRSVAALYDYLAPTSIMIDRVMPSVVQITINTGLFHPITGEEGIIYGTGMVISKDGNILTCNHLMDRLSNKKASGVVKLSNGRIYKIKKFVGDDFNDLAVAKIEPNEPLMPVELNEPKTVKLGDEVWAIGNPFDLGLSVSNGAVSRIYDYVQYTGSIQINASLNPGNSGCPVFDRLGKVVGVAVSLRSGAQGGISFVIGMDKVSEVLPGLLSRLNEQ